MLNQEAGVATIEAKYKQAETLTLEANEELYKEGLISSCVKLKRAQADRT